MTAATEAWAKGVFLSCVLASAAIVSMILVFMIVLGLPVFQESAFFSIWAGPWSPAEGSYGILPMLAGTVWISLLATAFALPLSLGTSFVAVCLGGPGVKRFLASLTRFMTGIPTVIYGFVGIFLLVPFIRKSFGGPGMCVLAASLVLAVLISPTMILFFSESLLAVNPAHVRAAKALGADRMQRLLYVMLPGAVSGMTSGFILALGRALGDTLVALMLAGNAIQAPHGLLDPARTLTAHIALVKAAEFDSLEFRSIFACGIALYLLTTCATLSVRWVENKRKAAN